MAPSIPAKLQKSKRPVKNPAGPPYRFFFFYMFLTFFSRGWDEMFFVMCNDTFPSFLQKLAGDVITKIRQVTHGYLVGDFSTRLRLARNDKSESARNDRDMTHTLRTPIGSSGEEGEIWMAWPPSASWRPLKKVLTIYVSENRIDE